LLLWALPSVAQVRLGDLSAQAEGELTAGYNGSFGNQQTSDHAVAVGGNGTVGGYYYNPQFLSFSVLPYYDRSQDNSDTQSLTDSSGYTGTLNVFSGSHFPGFIGVNQQWNGSGTFGIPGVAGLTTNTDSRGLNLGWSALLPNLPTLSVGFSDTTADSTVYGSDSSSASTSRTFTLGSSYTFAGFVLNGGFNHVTTDATLTGLLENGSAETTDGSSNQVHFTALRDIPFYHSQISFGLSRGTYTDDTDGDRQYGTTDAANVSTTLKFPKVPVTVYANYTDNLFGSFEQQLLASGQAPFQTSISPASHSLTMGASAFYTVLPGITVNGFVNHTAQVSAGQTYGLTQFGGNVNYSLFRRIRGLSFSVGVVDSAGQQGNTRAGLVGNVDYRRDWGQWETDCYFRYDQNVQTLLVAYTISTMTYGASLKRQLVHDVQWVAVANSTQSVFEQQSGDGNRGESFTSMVLWHWITVSGNFMESKGTSIITATGLVATPVPGQELSPSNLVVYNGNSYGGSLRLNPLRSLGLSASYAKAASDTISSLLPSNNASTEFYGLLTYRLRKLLFTAGATKFRQSISTSGTPPSMVTSYYFGVSRWFKGF
jgi:hypothetical protein